MKEIKPLMIANILCISALMAFLSVVGPLIRELGLQEWHAGLTVAVAGVIWIVTARAWGKRSDRTGRRIILLAGTLGFTASYMALAAFVDFALVSPPAVVVTLFILIFTRGMIGLFYSAVPPVSAAYIADKVEPVERASYMAKLGASTGMGMIFGPAFGGMLAVYGLAVPLYVAALLPLIAFMVLYFKLPESKQEHTEQDGKVKMVDPRLRLPMSAAFLTMYSVVTSQVCLGFFVMDGLGLGVIESSKVTGYTLSSIGITFVASQIAVSRFRSVMPSLWLRIGAVTAGIGMAVVSVMDSQLVLIFGFCVASLGMGMIFPAFQALAANSVESHEQGMAAGTVSAAQGIGMIAGPLVSTALYGLDPVVPFAAASLAFIFLSVVSLRHKDRNIVPEPAEV
ncbi:major facilitator superfamily MFS_1 [Denitrovibrio acetiphilus DSM 12809]|uniref:Major facilitator superfamily MFS_1 n=1 Tax=Denitrovibrio acetiphilus (strain DSM 12809 / NBRC 114555 / N2460) TaxID=522772 RepID=D4H8L8_DENA2|nr:MFS transporter [Denitrovibrio acetiphilus]ADD68367.1 major facilitator superfamily MFS_1 [Denitrovibrio acetiphilus DSM 12809]